MDFDNIMDIICSNIENNFETKYNYFYATYREELDPMDNNGYYHGFLIDVNDNITPVKIPTRTYLKIPKELRRNPDKYHMFAFDKFGDISTNVLK